MRSAFMQKRNIMTFKKPRDHLKRKYLAKSTTLLKFVSIETLDKSTEPPVSVQIGGSEDLRHMLSKVSSSIQ